jgi:hypothetical protein
LVNILATLHGGYKVEPTWRTNHIDIANLYGKITCLIVSSLWLNTYFVLLCQFNYSSSRILCKYFCLKRYLQFFYKNIIINWHIWTSDLYMEATDNIPLPFRFHRNFLAHCISWTIANCCRKAFHHACLWPTISTLNVTFGGEFSKTIDMVSLLWRSMLLILFLVCRIIQPFILP